MNFFCNILFLSLISLCFIFFTAASPFDEIDSSAKDGNYINSLQLINERRNNLYKNDLILYNLDAGILSHFAGRYNDSIRLLQNSERAIEEAYTKSIAEEIASLLISENVKTYAGEDYEDIYINIINALNYYHLNRHEEALVEARRIGEKLKFLENNYDSHLKLLLETSIEFKRNERLINNAIRDAEKLGIVLTLDTENNNLYTYKINNLALGRYLSMLFYRANGLMDNARIDNESIKEQFKQLPDLYKFSAPSSLDDELNIPPGTARLNLLAFTGLSPVKMENSTFVMITSQDIRIALPEMKYRPSLISRVEIEFEDGSTINMERLEDIEAIARETFKGKIELTKLKANIRAVIKGGITNTGLLLSSFLPVLGIAVSEITYLIADASEKADLRVSRYFPGKSYVGGVNLKPGTYSFNINYRDSKDQLIESFAYKNVQVKEGALNLIESFSLK